jgi:hypothetical protein
MNFHSFNNRGSSLLEVIIAIALFGFICSALVSMSLGGFTSLYQGGEYVEAEAFAQEGIEAVRTIRDSAWNKLTYTTSAVTSTGNVWQFVGENSTSTLGKYSRTISFASVCRDGTNTIVACPGSYTDLNTKQALVTVSWLSAQNVVNSIQKVTYLTNWDSRDWTQTSWSGGTGQSVWSDATKYSSDDGNLDLATSGEIKLISSGTGCGTKNWTFDTASDYAYDGNKIEVTSGVSRLKSSGSGGLIDASTQGIWHLDEGSGSVVDFSGNGNNLTNVTGAPVYSQSGKFGTAVSFGGNSSRYINNGQQTGLGITGALTIDAWIYRTAAANTIESIISKWRDTGNKRSYALNVGSDNRLAFWVSSNGSASFSTIAVNTVPLNQWVHVAGVYDGTHLYVFQNGNLESSIVYSNGISNKSAFVSLSGADSFAGGDAFFNGKIDEARISNTARWTASFTPPNGAYGLATYAVDTPTLLPNTAHTALGIDTWSGFSETATKNGGEVYYQLSDNGGSTWNYWNGSAWVQAGAANYNTASVIGTNISTFPTSTGQIMFQAFLSSDGSQQVILDNVQVSCEKQHNWDFANSADYTFNASKIAVAGGSASLVDQGGGGSCSGIVNACSTFLASNTCQAQAGCSWGGSDSGGTTNSNFTTVLTPWTIGSWNTAPTRSRVTSGGNPTAYAKIQFLNTKSVTSGGYFQQSFVVTGAASTATLNLDWIVSQFTGAADSLRLYAFVDTVSGAPTIGGAGQVWDSGNRTGTSGWASTGNINVASKIPAAGTYYLKIATYVDYTNGGSNRQYATGFDNIQLSWTKANFCSGTPSACNTFVDSSLCGTQLSCLWTSSALYPTDSPSINPVALYTGTVNAWTSFTESATKNGGQIQYQLTSDGTNWKYWNGSAWVAAGAGNYNDATVINTNIGSFSTTTGQIMAKAFLTSNGTQQVTLDNVRVGWGESDSAEGGGYSTTGNFMSSAFNMSDASPVHIVQWDQDVSGCNDCNIQLQLRTAPDNGGSPGVWSSWYGALGEGTYFTNPLGTLVPLNLNGYQWMQYRAEFSGDGVNTPSLQQVKFNYK